MGLDELVHPPGADPGEVADRDDGDQGGVGPLAVLEEPLREVPPLPQLGERDGDGADAGVELAAPVSVVAMGSAVR